MDGLKFIFIFLIIGILLWKRVPLVYVMLGSSLVLAFLFHIGFQLMTQVIWKAVSNQTTLELVLILISIMIIEHLLREHGYFERMLNGLNGFIQERRVILALLPAFIGLMPSVGGALFSAPLVEQAAAGTSLNAEHKSFINYYFRHTSEYFLPVYPGVLLTAHISGIPLPQFIVALIPYGLIVILLGIPGLLRMPIEKGEKHEVTGRGKNIKEFLIYSSPIMAIVFLVLVLKVAVGIAAGMIIAILVIIHRYTPVRLFRLLQKAVKFKTIILVFSIMIFKQMLTDTNAVNGLPILLENIPVPRFIIFGLVSLLVGLLTGIMVACIGISLPIAMVGMQGNFPQSLVVFLFICGFTGTMLTPLHLCLTLTLEYFKADFNKVVRMVIGPEMGLLIVAIGIFLLS